MLVTKIRAIFKKKIVWFCFVVKVVRSCAVIGEGAGGGPGLVPSWCGPGSAAVQPHWGHCHHSPALASQGQGPRGYHLGERKGWRMQASQQSYWRQDAIDVIHLHGWQPKRSRGSWRVNFDWCLAAWSTLWRWSWWCANSRCCSSWSTQPDTWCPTTTRTGRRATAESWRLWLRISSLSSPPTVMIIRILEL